jgi:hypothetical protein
MNEVVPMLHEQRELAPDAAPKLLSLRDPFLFEQLHNHAFPACHNATTSPWGKELPKFDGIPLEDLASL